MFKATRATLNSGPAGHLQFELQVYRDTHTSIVPSPLPDPPGSPPLTEPYNFELPLNKLRSKSDLDAELNQAETGSQSPEITLRHRLMSDCMSLESQASGEERVQAIRQVLTLLSIQVLAIAIWTGCLIKNQPTLVCQVVAIGTLSAGCLLLSHFNTRLRPVVIVITFAVTSAAVPYVASLATRVFETGTIGQTLVQLGAMTIGLTLYAWTTRYEDWSSKEELVFSIAPVCFTSMVCCFLFGTNMLPAIVTGIAVAFLGAVVGDCAKDITIPAQSLDQRLLDVASIYSNGLSRSRFLIARKAARLFEKATIR